MSVNFFVTSAFPPLNVDNFWTLAITLLDFHKQIIYSGLALFCCVSYDLEHIHFHADKNLDCVTFLPLKT